MVELVLPEPVVVWLVIAALASWRIASILHREGIMRPLRRLFGIYEKDGVVFYPDTFFGELLGCLWCLSVWTALGTTLLLFIFPYVLLPFAFSSIAILIDRVVGRG